MIDMKKIIVLSCFVMAWIGCSAQNGPDSLSMLQKVYRLGEVKIKAATDKTTVDANEIERYNATNVGAALNILPSVILNEDGARNETTVYIRGFDLRSVPVYMDGIPVYVPYDGYADLGRFLTFDLSKIDVAKGFSSMTYGANTIGGAINLVGMKPHQLLEMKAKIGIMSGKGYETALNLGGNFGKIYFQSGFSLLDRRYIPLSAKFDTLGLEKDHRRDNSYHKDTKVSIRIGFTPNARDEYTINYQYSHGTKGNPVYLGNDVNTRVRYWQWPYWNKQSLYYISNTAIGDKSGIKVRAYFDQFRNKISSFDDNTYSTQNKGSSFNSFYDDYTLGGNMEFWSDWNSQNHVSASLHLKNDNHREHNDEEPVRHFADNTWSFGIENVYRPGQKLRFIPGLSYNIRNSLRAENYNSADGSISDYPANKNSCLNAQLSSYYMISNSFNVNLDIAWKSRFATMKDRYSYRLGTALPNPDLKSETALNLELGTTILTAGKLNLRPEIFYSHLFNTMQMVSNVQGDLSQTQNTGEAVFSGIDMNLGWQPAKILKIYGAYSYIHRRNISNPEILFTDVPDHKVFVSAEYRLIKRILVNLSGEYDSRRNNASDGSNSVDPVHKVINVRCSNSKN